MRRGRSGDGLAEGSFGAALEPPEYDRTVEDKDSRRRAEIDLRQREERHALLDVHPLPPEARDRYVWVVREHRVRYHRPAFAGEALRATTWVGETSGATSVRHTRLTRAADDALLCEAETTWVLLDPRSGRPVRVEAEVLGWLRNDIF